MSTTTQDETTAAAVIVLIRTTADSQLHGFAGSGDFTIGLHLYYTSLLGVFPLFHNRTLLHRALSPNRPSMEHSLLSLGSQGLKIIQLWQTVHTGVSILGGKISSLYKTVDGWEKTLSINDIFSRLLPKKSRIRETKNLSTDADSRTDTILERLHD